MGLWLLFALGSCLGFLVGGWLASIGQLCLGIGITLTLLRAVTYFRDRERASTFGVFDAVEMVRVLHHLVKEILADSPYLADLQSGKAQRISLSFLGHSMGTFLTTMLIRVHQCFDPKADTHLWTAIPSWASRTQLPSQQLSNRTPHRTNSSRRSAICSALIV